MRFDKKYLLLFIILNQLFGDHLENFYKLLNNSSVIKLNINFTQNQFQRNYKSFGDFFILGPKKYFYDSSDLKISFNHKYVITKNYLNKQIIYNDLVEGELNLFDILSGDRDYIEFSDNKVIFNKYNFYVPSMGFNGYFLFDPELGNLKLIFFEIDHSQSVSIDINKIEILDSYNPEIKEEDFEVIDLRG